MLAESHDEEQIIARVAAWTSVRRSWCAVCGCRHQQAVNGGCRRFSTDDDEGVV